MKHQGMEMSTKLVIINIVTVLIVAGSAAAYFYVNVSSGLISPLQNRLQYILGVISQTIDAAALAGVEGPSDTGTVEYRMALLRLRDLRRLNKDIAFLYVMRKVGDEIQFVVDSGEAKGRFMPGRVYDDASSNLRKGFTMTAVENKISKDEGRTFLSGYSPIVNGDGRYLLGIDMRADEVAHELRRLHISGAVFLILSMVIAFLFSHRLFAGFTLPHRSGISYRPKPALNTHPTH